MSKIFTTWCSVCHRQTRFDWLYIATSLGLLAGIFLTLPLWSTIRTYPLAPVVPGFSLPNELHIALLFLIVFCLLFGLVYKKYRALVVSIALGSLALSSLLDITRFHPWILHYFGILLLFSFLVGNKNNHEPLLDAARIIVGGIYFWSGVQKINVYFITTVFPWFTEPFWAGANDFIISSFLAIGLFVPFIEAGFALGLFSKRFRNLSIVGSTAMILLVLAALGPFGHNWNSSVWPWNIAIFSMVIILFWKANFTLPEFIKRQRKNYIGLVMFLVFWIMPVGNIFGLVDDYLSWSLYSGHVPQAALVGDQLLLEKLSPAATNGRLKFTYWTMTEMNQIPYPADRVFRYIFADVCDLFADDDSLALEITSSKRFSSNIKNTSSTKCVE